MLRVEDPLGNTEVIVVQTIKTAVVVVLLMVILYGAFVAMNGQETELPPDLESMITMGPDFGFEGPSASTSTTTPSSPAPLPAAPTADHTPFAMWPEPQKSAADNAEVVKPSIAQDVSKPSALLLPPETVAGVDNSKSADQPKSENSDGDVVSTTNGTAETGADKDKDPASDPWLKTLQKSVAGSNGGTNKTASESSQFEPPQVPATLASDVKKESEDDQSDQSDVAKQEKKSPEFSVTSQSFENAKTKALEQYAQGKLKESLQTLSLFYNSPELTAEQRADLLDMLDSMAYEVIYSKRHLMDLPYIVAPGETLAQVAQMHDLPPEVLAKVNGISETEKVAPGTKLKVMRGPFRTEINVATKEMTLFLGDLYAGRFPVSTGTDPEPREGVFQIIDKQRDRTYYGPGGMQIGGDDPRNPYGGVWLNLGQEMSIHGSPTNPASETERLGCISLSPLDASDVFTMLSRGSQVTIKR